MLLRHAVDRAHVAGAAVLRITSDPNAVGFYERRGARQVGSIASSIPGRDLPLMELHVRRGQYCQRQTANPDRQHERLGDER